MSSHYGGLGLSPGKNQSSVSVPVSKLGSYKNTI